MFKLNRKQQRLPIGGHRFTDEGHTMRGETFDEVVQLLTDYRLNNHIQLGNPEQDVLVYYALNWPYMVEADYVSKELPIPDEYEEYRSWLNRVWKSPPNKTISQKEASERWPICKTCPFHKNLNAATGKELDELKRKAFLLRRGQEVPPWLGICSLHLSADLSVVSFVEKPGSFVTKREDNEKPGKCWIL